MDKKKSIISSSVKEHTIESIRALELVLAKLGYKFKQGSAIDTAEKILGG